MKLLFKTSSQLQKKKMGTEKSFPKFSHENWLKLVDRDSSDFHLQNI